MSQFKLGDRVRVKTGKYTEDWDHVEGVVIERESWVPVSNTYVQQGDVGPRRNERIHSPTEYLELVPVEAPVPAEPHPSERFKPGDKVVAQGEVWVVCSWWTDDTLTGSERGRWLLSKTEDGRNPTLFLDMQVSLFVVPVPTLHQGLLQGETPECDLKELPVPQPLPCLLERHEELHGDPAKDQRQVRDVMHRLHYLSGFLEARMGEEYGILKVGELIAETVALLERRETCS